MLASRFRSSGYDTNSSGRRTDKGLSARFKGIEIIRAERARIESADGAQAGPVDSSRIVIHAGEVRLLHIVDPDCETAIIGTRRRCGTPVQFKEVGRISNRKPICVRPGGPIIADGCTDLVCPGGATEFDSEDIRRGAGIPVENVMGISARHADGIWVEIKTGAIANFSIGSVIGNIYRRCVVDDRS